MIDPPRSPYKVPSAFGRRKPSSICQSQLNTQNTSVQCDAESLGRPTVVAVGGIGVAERRHGGVGWSASLRMLIAITALARFSLPHT